MATIYERKNANGTSTYRVMIRRKGIRLLCLAFSCEKEAKEWVKEHEHLYIDDPETYLQWIQKERLNLQRKREFDR